jgi:hypothetical protein
VAAPLADASLLDSGRSRATVKQFDGRPDATRLQVFFAALPRAAA